MTLWLRLLNITALYGVVIGENIHFEGHVNIKSPNYPNGIPAQMQKDWIVTCPEGSRIHVSFAPFNVPHSDYCKMMYISVSEGKAKSDVREEVRFCGDKYQNVTTSSNHATIILRADGGTTDSNFIIHLEEMAGGIISEDVPSKVSQQHQIHQQNHQQHHQQQHQQHQQHQSQPPQPTQPTQPPQPTQPTQPTQPNKPTQASNFNKLEYVHNLDIPNTNSRHPSTKHFSTQHVTNHQRPPTTKEVINTDEQNMSIDEFNLLKNQQMESINSARNNNAQNVHGSHTLLPQNHPKDVRYSTTTSTNDENDPEIKIISTETTLLQDEVETTTGIYEKYLVKDDWFRIHNDGVPDIIPEEPFNAEKYEWAFGLAAVVFSVSVGAIIICCYNKKAEKEERRRRTESGCPLPVDKRSSFSQSMMPPLHSMPSVWISASDVNHQNRRPSQGSSIKSNPKVPIRIIPIPARAESNGLIRPVSRDNS